MTVFYGWKWTRSAGEAEDVLERATLHVSQDGDQISDLDGNDLLVQEAHIDCGEEFIPSDHPICRVVDDHPTCLTIINETDEWLLIIEVTEAVALHGVHVDWLSAHHTNTGKWTLENG